MKKSIIKIILSLILIYVTIVFTNNVQAASANITSSGSSSTTVEEGKSVTVNLSVNAAAWNVSVNGGGLTTSDTTSFAGYSEDTMNTNFSKTITYNTTKAGTYKISLSGDITDESKTTADNVSGTVTVTVTAKQTENPTTPSTPQTPTTPTVTEPKFTSVNKTMYATGDINLRASWSTSSAATTITKGTELKVTGTSTDKVNGYVWYRVSYNGATKYVASSLLTNTKPEEEKKSDNAFLKSLTIEGQELMPEFNKETTAYTMQVTSEITELNIKAEAEDEKASVSIQGNKDLKDGENKATISVSAEDGTTKIYEITITKSEKIALGLKSLVIKDTDIASMFKADTYEYEIYVKDVAKLEITAIANDETATVEILGNEDLQEGENIITIIVSSQDGEEKVTYQIKVVKTDTTTKEQQVINPKIYLYVGIGIVLLIALIIVIAYTIKHRNQEEFEYSDNFEDSPEELPERQEKEEYEENSIEENESNIEQTQEIEYNQGINYNDEKIEINQEVELNEDELEKQQMEDRKSKIDYFLDVEEDEKPRHRKGKHF